MTPGWSSASRIPSPSTIQGVISKSPTDTSPVLFFDSQGRNSVYVPTLVLFVASNFLAAFAPNYGSLMAGRFWSGFFGSPSLAVSRFQHNLLSLLSCQHVVIVPDRLEVPALVTSTTSKSCPLPLHSGPSVPLLGHR